MLKWKGQEMVYHVGQRSKPIGQYNIKWLRKRKSHLKMLLTHDERERERDQTTYVHTLKMLSYILKSSKFLNASKLLIT